MPGSHSTRAPRHGQNSFVYTSDLGLLLFGSVPILLCRPWRRNGARTRAVSMRESPSRRCSTHAGVPAYRASWARRGNVSGDRLPHNVR